MQLDLEFCVTRNVYINIHANGDFHVSGQVNVELKLPITIILLQLHPYFRNRSS